MNTIVIHPLAISCICDHYTRASVGGSLLPPFAPVAGLLFGSTDEQGACSVADATDSIYAVDPKGNVCLNEVEMSKKITLWTSIGENRKLLGWYTLGKTVGQDHVLLHAKMKKFGDTLLFLLMDPTPEPTSRHSSFAIYKSATDGSGIFIEVPFKLEALDAERIALDCVIKSSAIDPESPASGLLGLSRKQSIVAIQSRVTNIIAALSAMVTGDVALDHSLLRTVSKICSELPIPVSEHELDFDNELVSTMAISLLSSLTRSAEVLGDINGKGHYAYGDRHYGHGR